MPDAAATAADADKAPAREADHRYAPLSWDAARAVRDGLIPGPYPEDFNGKGFEPTAPTAGRPGTPEKIAVLAERYARREQLFHPRDAK